MVLLPRALYRKRTGTPRRFFWHSIARATTAALAATATATAASAPWTKGALALAPIARGRAASPHRSRLWSPAPAPRPRIWHSGNPAVLRMEEENSAPEAPSPIPSGSNNKNTGDGHTGPSLEALCGATLAACEAVTPAVEALYRSISRDHEQGKNNGGGKTKTKEDDSVFTIADGLVQHLLVETLLGCERERESERAGASRPRIVGDVVGEEDCPVDLSSKPYKVDDLLVPGEFEEAIEQAIEGVSRAREALLPPERDAGGVLHPSLVAFVDPIDGTREFSTKKGDQCTICVGFADASSGRPVAGVVYRPLSEKGPTWAAGAPIEGYCASELAGRESSPGDETRASSLLTSNGGISPFLEALLGELGCSRAPSGGAGNKVLMLLEAEQAGARAAYIQDRGVSRWDTCASQAVLEAHGGILCRLDAFLGGRDRSSSSGSGGGWSYTYRKTLENTDFVPGLARLTKYNASGETRPGGGPGEAAAPRALRPSEVKPYANLCGLVALGKSQNHERRRAEIKGALERAAEASPPAYD